MGLDRSADDPREDLGRRFPGLGANTVF